MSIIFSVTNMRVELFSQVCKPVSMYRCCCFSFKLCIYLPSPEPCRIKKKTHQYLLSICSFHETYLVSGQPSKDFCLYYANKVTLVFWNVVFAGIPPLVHTVPYEWHRKLKLVKMLFWIAVSFAAKFASQVIFCSSSSVLQNGLKALKKGISFPEKPQKLLGHGQNEAWKCKDGLKGVTIFGQSLDGYRLSFTTLRRLRTTLGNCWGTSSQPYKVWEKKCGDQQTVLR